VISEALGCKEWIEQGTCGTCNNTFGHSFEGKLINGLALFLNFFQIANGTGTIPSVRMIGRIESEEFNLRVTGDGKAEAPPKLLPTNQIATGPERTFRIFHKAQEQKIENDLRSKHPDLAWSRVPKKQLKWIIDARAEFDVHMLCGADANRTVAKYAVNLLTHQYGYDWVKGRFQDLIAYVKGQRSSTRAGILWEPDLIRRFPLAPPKHLFVIVCDSKSRGVAIFLYLFCLLPFCVLTEDARVLVDSAKTIALDPMSGRFAPLFLSGSRNTLISRRLPAFPMPEFEFSDRLRRAEIGTSRQAEPAAVNALNFLKAVATARSEVSHICYNCKKILPELTPICGHCGKSPLPEEAA
jgi:hypothetical protein